MIADKDVYTVELDFDAVVTCGGVEEFLDYILEEIGQPLLTNVSYHPVGADPVKHTIIVQVTGYPY
jgi:hypothetical protein